MDCSPPGSFVHGILQARILEWVAMPSFKGSSWPRDRTRVFYISCTGRRDFFFTTSTTWEAQISIYLYLSIYICIYEYSKKAMAPHSSTLAWKIPWMEVPGGLQSMGSLRIGHDWVTSLSLFTFMHWRRKWQPTPVFLPRESQGRGSLVGCRPWGRTESDTTEAT